jgi:MtrB/PioB family decaheme-associated outer membrane protein
MSELPFKYPWKQQSCAWCIFRTIGGERMKAKIIVLALIIGLVLLSDAFPQDRTMEGEISVSGVLINVEGKEGGHAKFTEYRDLRGDGGVYGRARLNLDTEKYFLNFEGSDFGYDTQYYKIDGGMWGKFKFDLFYDEIPHNIAFDARTFFSGAGRDTLTGAPNTNVGSWNTFDYSSERRKYGGSFKFDMLKPLFFDVSYSREEKEGIKPAGIAATTPGGISVELPEPIDYVTNNMKLEAGYAKAPLFLSVNYFYSSFNNSNENLNFWNPVTGAADTLALPPDNHYYKLAFNGGIKLPFNTRFNTNLGNGRTTSEHSFFPSFDGKVETQNYDFVVTSNPVRFLDAKVYYKYYKRDNKSDESLGIVDVFFNYKISTTGADLGFRLPAKFYLTGGYKYVRTNRENVGETDPTAVLPFNKDNIYSVELKWNGLDFMDLRVGYEKLDRDAQYRTAETAVALARRFAYAAQNRDTYKAHIDIFPLDKLNAGLEYRYRNTDYTDTMLGLKSDKRNEISIDADYTIGNIAKLYGYSDFGWVKFDQLQQTVVTPGNWDAKQWDRTFGYGIGAEIYAIPNKLTLVFQHDYLKSNGSVDYFLDPILFTAASGTGLAGVGANNNNVDIGRWDDYTLYSFRIKTVYNFTKSLAALVGYAYERYNYKDAQLDGYRFVNPLGGPVTGTNGAYLTGAYNDQSYNANIVFGGVTYKF